MDAIVLSFPYYQKRREFGRRVQFSDEKTTVISVESASKFEKQWVERATTVVELDCIPVVSQHAVNTEVIEKFSKGTLLTEGAWPDKSSDAAARKNIIKKLKRESDYAGSVVNLVKTAEGVVQQNNTVDLYEDFFVGTEHETFSHTAPSCKTICVCRDPNETKRSATKITWHPESPNKLAVSYSIMEFQGMKSMGPVPLTSYVWDLHSPNQPDAQIIPTSPLTCLMYNPRSPDHLVGGSYNGLIGFWDLRKGSSPVEMSLIEKSHKDPVYDVFWVQSRTGNECCSTSTDGQLLFWDIRKMSGGPMDGMALTMGAGGASGDVLYGGTSMEYRSDAGATRYLVGTEQGTILLCDRKPKKDSESQKTVKTNFGAKAGKHLGPVYSVQRNPFFPKYFLSVGDWTAKVWMEDLKTPVMTSRFDDAYLTAGCWSPTRPGVFFTSKQDGSLDVWDYLHKHHDPIFSTKVSDVGLASLKLHSSGKLAALGGMDGSLTVLELSEALSEMQKDEKSAMNQMFEREKTREASLDRRALAKKEAKSQKRKTGLALPAAAAASPAPAQDLSAAIKQAEEQFRAFISGASAEEKEGVEKKDGAEERDEDDDDD